MFSSLISVVVPIYQVEKYIAKCMESICNQTFRDFEIILVNDGTRDKSLFVAEAILQSSDIKYSIVNQSNCGVSSARNCGIKHSLGEWVICIDPDDVLHKDFLQMLYSSCKQNSTDLAIGNFQYAKETSEVNWPNVIFNDTVFDKQTILKLFLTRELKIISPAMLLRKEFLTKHNLWYNEDMHFSEDQHFIWRVLFNIEKCVYNKTIIYNYFVRENSTMTSSSIEKIMTGYDGFISFNEVLNCKKYTDIYDMILPRWVLSVLCVSTSILSYNSFEILANKMNYKEYSKKLLRFPDFKVGVLAIILCLNLRGFYIFMKKVNGRK